jgi:hypothetical protein
MRVAAGPFPHSRLMSCCGGGFNGGFESGRAAIRGGSGRWPTVVSNSFSTGGPAMGSASVVSLGGWPRWVRPLGICGLGWV